MATAPLRKAELAPLLLAVQSSSKAELLGRQLRELLLLLLRMTGMRLLRRGVALCSCRLIGTPMVLAGV